MKISPIANIEGKHMRHRPRPALLVTLLLLLAALATFMVLLSGCSDGYIAEPGCDWGNSHCEVEDYEAMCAQYDGSVHDARWVQYCAGRVEGTP